MRIGCLTLLLIISVSLKGQVSEGSKTLNYRVGLNCYSLPLKSIIVLNDLDVLEWMSLSISGGVQLKREVEKIEGSKNNFTTGNFISGGVQIHGALYESRGLKPALNFDFIYSRYKHSAQIVILDYNYSGLGDKEIKFSYNDYFIGYTAGFSLYYTEMNPLFIETGLSLYMANPNQNPFYQHEDLKLYPQPGFGILTTSTKRAALGMQLKMNLKYTFNLKSRKVSTTS